MGGVDTLFDLVVNRPFESPLSYSSGGQDLKLGQFVKVPLGRGNKATKAFVVAKSLKSNSDYKIKNILPVDENNFCLSKDYLLWASWLSEYYLHPLGQVMAHFIPPAKKSKKVSVKVEPLKKELKIEYTLEQKKVLSDISIDEGFGVHLLHGVTGSGKTEIYLDLFEQCIDQGKQVLCLVPEISLTPQLFDRFETRFGKGAVACIHSQMTPRQKTNFWWEMQNGSKQILLGARSALFCPLDRLGLIVVDEEHESSFKQDEKLKYSGKDSAIKLAHIKNIPIVLGSATPSIESWNRAQEGKYKYHELKQKAYGQEFPEIKIIDLKKENKNPALPFWMSEALYVALSKHLSQGQQVALFLNRRGVSSSVICRLCADQKMCPDCDISLTLHGHKYLLCHYCSYQEPYKTHCTSCGEGKYEPIGLGTEKVEEDLKLLFPDYPVARADRDEISSRKEMEQLVRDLEHEKFKILVGTQMIAKGLDFSKLSLVALVLSDVGLNVPDFRSMEKNYQLMVQMAGRCGRRKEQKAEVLIQTLNPKHPCHSFVLARDYIGMAQAELPLRKSFHYPPFYRVAFVRIQSPDQNKIAELSENLLQKCLQLQSQFKAYSSIEILGPAPAPVQKIKNQYRYLLLLKSPKSQLIQKFYKHLKSNLKTWWPERAKISIDIDPV